MNKDVERQALFEIINEAENLPESELETISGTDIKVKKGKAKEFENRAWAFYQNYKRENNIIELVGQTVNPTKEVYSILMQEKTSELDEHLISKAYDILQEFPSLVEKFNADIATLNAIKRDYDLHSKEISKIYASGEIISREEDIKKLNEELRKLSQDREAITRSLNEIRTRVNDGLIAELKQQMKFIHEDTLNALRGTEVAFADDGVSILKSRISEYNSLYYLIQMLEIAKGKDLEDIASLEGVMFVSNEQLENAKTLMSEIFFFKYIKTEEKEETINLDINNQDYLNDINYDEYLSKNIVTKEDRLNENRKLIIELYGYLDELGKKISASKSMTNLDLRTTKDKKWVFLANDINEAENILSLIGLLKKQEGIDKKLENIYGLAYINVSDIEEFKKLVNELDYFKDKNLGKTTEEVKEAGLDDKPIVLDPKKEEIISLDELEKVRAELSKLSDIVNTMDEYFLELDDYDVEYLKDKSGYRDLLEVMLCLDYTLRRATKNSENYIKNAKKVNDIYLLDNDTHGINAYLKYWNNYQAKNPEINDKTRKDIEDIFAAYYDGRINLDYLYDRIDALELGNITKAEKDVCIKALCVQQYEDLLSILLRCFVEAKYIPSEYFADTEEIEGLLINKKYASDIKRLIGEIDKIETDTIQEQLWDIEEKYLGRAGTPVPSTGAEPIPVSEPSAGAEPIPAAEPSVGTQIGSNNDNGEIKPKDEIEKLEQELKRVENLLIKLETTDSSHDLLNHYWSMLYACVTKAKESPEGYFGKGIPINNKNLPVVKIEGLMIPKAYEEEFKGYQEEMKNAENKVKAFDDMMMTKRETYGVPENNSIEPTNNAEAQEVPEASEQQQVPPAPEQNPEQPQDKPRKKKKVSKIRKLKDAVKTVKEARKNLQTIRAKGLVKRLKDIRENIRNVGQRVKGTIVADREVGKYDLTQEEQAIVETIEAAKREANNIPTNNPVDGASVQNIITGQAAEISTSMLPLYNVYGEIIGYFTEDGLTIEKNDYRSPEAQAFFEQPDANNQGFYEYTDVPKTPVIPEPTRAPEPENLGGTLEDDNAYRSPEAQAAFGNNEEIPPIVIPVSPEPSEPIIDLPGKDAVADALNNLSNGNTTSEEIETLEEDQDASLVRTTRIDHLKQEIKNKQLLLDATTETKDRIELKAVIDVLRYELDALEGRSIGR